MGLLASAPPAATFGSGCTLPDIEVLKVLGGSYMDESMQSCGVA